MEQQQLGDKSAWGLLCTLSWMQYLNTTSYLSEFLPRGALMRGNGDHILEAISLKSLQLLFLSTALREPSSALGNGLGVCGCPCSISAPGSSTWVPGTSDGVLKA